MPRRTERGQLRAASRGIALLTGMAVAAIAAAAVIGGLTLLLVG